MKANGRRGQRRNPLLRRQLEVVVAVAVAVADVAVGVKVATVGIVTVMVR